MKLTLMLFLINRKQIGNKMHTRAMSPVRLSKETDPAKAKRVSTANAHHRDNVNVAQGPRTGNAGAHDGKRATFIEGKETRAPIAKVIEAAYAQRQHEYEDFEYTNGGSIHDNTRAKFKGKGKLA